MSSCIGMRNLLLIELDFESEGGLVYIVRI